LQYSVVSIVNMKLDSTVPVVYRLELLLATFINWNMSKTALLK